MRWAFATRIDLAQESHQATITHYIHHLNKIYLLSDWVKIQVENYCSIRICSVYVQFRDDKHSWKYMEEYSTWKSSWMYGKWATLKYSMQGMVWNGMEDDFSIFHTDNFLPFHFHSILKIFHSVFHSILKFSSIFHSILPYQKNFRLEAMQRIFCCFASLWCCKQPLVKVRQQY